MAASKIGARQGTLHLAIQTFHGAGGADNPAWLEPGMRNRERSAIDVLCGGEIDCLLAR